MMPDPVRPALPRASLYLLGLAWTIPFLQPYHRYPIPSLYNEWLALALGLAAALLLLRAESWRAARAPAVALFPLGLVLLLGLQIGLDRITYPEEALLAALYLLWATLLALLGWTLRQELGLGAVVGALAWSLVAGGLLNGIVALLQLYDAAGPLAFLVAERSGRAVYGNLQQRNHFATYLALATASAGYLFARGRLSGRWTVACTLFFMLVLGVSSSRSAWLYVVTFAAFALALYGLRRDAASRRLACFAVSLLPAFALTQWIATLPFLRPVGEMVTATERVFEIAVGIRPRLQLAREAWQMFLAAPWTGVGWGEFAWEHFLHIGANGPGATHIITNHAHNIVLQLLAETGIAGAGMLFGAVVLWLRGLQAARLDAEWWWLLASLAVLGIHSLLEYPLWYAYFLGMAAVLVGLGARHTIAVRRAGAARALVALFAASGAIHLASVLGPYRELERLVFDLKRVAADRMTDAEFAGAITRLRGEPLVAPYVELFVATAMDITRDKLREKLEINTRAMHFRPAYNIALRQALLLALAGDGAAAARQLDLVARAYPYALEEALRQVTSLNREHPGEFTPLLELVNARRAELRARTLEDTLRR